MLFVVFTTSFAFKYIPDYLVEQSHVKLERDEYKLFYNYVYLNAYNKEEAYAEEVESTFNKIKKKDSLLLNHISRSLKKHENSIEKKQLEERLKILNTK